MNVIEKLRGTNFAHNVAVFIRHRQIDLYNKKILPKIIVSTKGKEKYKVAFIVYNVSMWKYHSLYKLMEVDDRFEPFIVFTPSPGKPNEIREKHLNEMKREFSNRGYKVFPNVVWNNLEFPDNFEADIIFLTQMYVPNFLTRELKKHLFCYCPYGFPSVSNSKWSVDTFLHNIAWKEFQATQKNIEISSKITYNKGKNRVHTGYLFGDELSKKLESSNGIWKEYKPNAKKIIWAPHFSIDTEHHFKLSNFLQIYDEMFSIAEKYKEQIQIAFKPHPFLYPTLCEEKFWGKEKADDYYKRWAELSNGQLSDGSYAELFSTSDAIIHDCGSFTIEYLYTRKPAMYLIENPEMRETDDLGKEALQCYYHGITIDEISEFIEKIVLGGCDPLQEKRMAFYEAYLLPPNGKSVAQNIVDCIVGELFNG